MKTRVEIVPHMSAFLVQSKNQKAYSVQLYPKETCNCPSTTAYWHIIASKLSVGIHSAIPAKHTLNLSQLKRNSRTRVDKRLGRKQPRPNDTDIEIIPASDSQGSILVADDINMPGKRTINLLILLTTPSPLINVHKMT